MNKELIDVIQREIHKAQQPLLDRIVELEKLQESDTSYICKLNYLVNALMDAYPQSHAKAAVKYLRKSLSNMGNDESGGYRALEIETWCKKLELLPKHPKKK